MNTKEKFDLFQLVTDQICDKLKQGTIPWVSYLKSGTNGYQLPRNLVTKKAYHGLNVLLLAMSQYSSPWWATFNQINQLGGRIRKGEHGTIIVFWKRLNAPETDQIEHEPEEHEHERPHFVLRYYRVWNSQQCEGLKVPESESATLVDDDITPIERAEEIARAYLARPDSPKFIEVDYARTASYSPAFHVITMAALKFHISAEEYAAAKFHEMVHGTSEQLGRKLDGKNNNREGYSREELVAEIGASMLCGLSGILERTIDNSTAYCAGWLKVLRSDKRAIVVAAGAAQKAADLIYGNHSEEVEHELSIAA